MNSFSGGVASDAKVRILTKEKKVVVKKLSALKPGDKLGQAGSRWYFRVDEVRITRRQQRGFVLTLETGEKVTVTEGTVICGQYGPNILKDVPDKLICYVPLNAFTDTTDSRRTFSVEFQGNDSHSKLIQRLCRGNAQNEKKFYRLSEVIKFLTVLTDQHPEIEIVPCLEISPHYKSGVYDMVSCVRTSSLYFPLIRIENLVTTWNRKHITPVVLAFCGNAERVSSRKVISCETVFSDGPWITPVFDTDFEESTSTQQRFSWTANGIPVFNPEIPYINDWAGKFTLPNKGQDTLLPVPKQTDYRFLGVSYAYNTLLKHYSPLSEEQSADSENLDALWLLINTLAKKGTSREVIKEYLISKIKAVCAPELNDS